MLFRSELPHVKHIVVFERVSGGGTEEPFILEGKEMWLEQLMGAGKQLLENN